METRAYAIKYKAEPAQPKIWTIKFVDIRLGIFSNSFQHLIRIKRITQTVADVVDGDDAEEDHQAGEDREPGIFDDVILRGADEIAPWRRGRLDAETEKTQARLLNDGVAEL